MLREAYHDALESVTRAEAEYLDDSSEDDSKSLHACEAADVAADAARKALLDSDEVREYTLTDDCDSTTKILARSLSEARIKAWEWTCKGNWNTSRGTVFVDVLIEGEAGDCDEITVSVDQPEPDCVDGEQHDWASPHAVVGGPKENPGVSIHGQGVIVIECCLRCGCRRRVDTWAQRPDTGEQGLTETIYHAGYYCSHPDWRAISGQKHPAKELEPITQEELDDIVHTRMSTLHLEEMRKDL